LRHSPKTDSPLFVEVVKEKAMFHSHRYAEIVWERTDEEGVRRLVGKRAEKSILTESLALE
jgi:hypothetical protein